MVKTLRAFHAAEPGSVAHAAYGSLSKCDSIFLSSHYTNTKEMSQQMSKCNYFWKYVKAHLGSIVRYVFLLIFINMKFRITNNSINRWNNRQKY